MEWIALPILDLTSARLRERGTQSFVMLASCCAKHAIYDIDEDLKPCFDQVCIAIFFGTGNRLSSSAKF
jgi:hypothetical protein